jgi:tetratricopeptide (TPR) repeat protein
MSEAKVKHLDAGDHLLRLKSFAEAAHDAGDFSRAETLWLAVQAEAEDFGSYDRRLTYVLEKIAEAQWNLQKYHLAAPMARRIVQIYKTMLGPAHSDVGTMLGNLGMLYLSWGKLEEAIDCYAEAIMIKKMSGGAESSEAQELAGQYELALDQYKNRRKHPGQSFPQVDTGGWRTSNHAKQGP